MVIPGLSRRGGEAGYWMFWWCCVCWFCFVIYLGVWGWRFGGEVGRAPGAVLEPTRNETPGEAQ